MSETPGIRLSLDDVLEYARSKAGTLRCPVCRHDHFVPATGDEARPIALLYEESGRSWFGPPGYLRVYALSCENCSYVVTFTLEALEAWALRRSATR